MTTTRQLTPKLFARKSIKGSPESFLAEHLTWLQGYSFLSPLLDAAESQEINAQECVEACKEALLMHSIQQEIEKAKASMQKSLARIDDQPRYTTTIYVKCWDKEKQQWGIKVGTQTVKRMIEDENGKVQVLEEEKELVFSSHLYQIAERIATLRLSKREDSVFAEIENTAGKTIRTQINRDQALGKMYPKERSAFTKRVAKGESKPFKNYPRVKNTYASFSRG